MKSANDVFEEGYNCAQSMIYAYGKTFFEEESLPLKLASGFGGGIASTGQTCGAVTGSLMVLGLYFGYADASDQSQKEKVKAIAQEFMDAFEAREGALKCCDLLGADMNTREGKDYVRRHGVIDKICPQLIKDASEILEKIMARHRG
jgi:C_GCAxxG_C_C family probable redox protein